VGKNTPSRKLFDAAQQKHLHENRHCIELPMLQRNMTCRGYDAIGQRFGHTNPENHYVPDR
jgi:hypothetical protein